ncbi:type II secretion system secretin GspD [Scleromatobacter humisilvae]|uniref:Type II secretion system secretin GspD n=1 Tax=Scleromatobacter humisilvae TaxID=2897159 RepID=A0A9X1YG75_9BURK|nr:type II secretion system secretin GspD [Scleromatobacter humisilvae]MCK9685448.1 type II secretion system secretin GspD [Scleromatobacter humisilvae]
MERLSASLRRLNATTIAIALLANSIAPIAQAAPRKDATASAEDAVPTSRARGTPVTLNFVNADIEAVSRAIGAMLNRDILVDPRVKGNITVYNDKPQPLSEAYRNYLSALRGLGFTVVESGGFLKVVPEADAKLQTSTVSVGAPSQRGDVVLTQIFKLNYENPNNLVAVLRPLITANNTINASPGNNSLVITDYADNLQRLGKIIAALDQPAGGELQVVPLKNAVATDVVQTVQKLIDGSSTAVQGVPGQGGGGTSVIVEGRTNSLIVRASNQSRMAYALSIIDKLDQPTPGGGPAGNIWVVYLKNSDAVKMAELLRAAISAGSAGNGGGGPSGGTGGAPTADGRTTAIQNPNAPTGTSGTAGGASAQSTTPVAASARPSTGGQVQADPATNALIITASEPVYRQMRQVIDQLDVRRAQVYVEALMIQVDAQKAADIGFQWQGLLGAGASYLGGGTNFSAQTSNSGGNIIDLAVAAGTAAATGGTTSTTTTTSGTTVSSQLGPGLNLGWVPKINGIYTLAALAHFLETNAGGNVLSTPNLIAMDNEEAKIVVGQNIPLITGSFTNTGGATSSVNPFQTVERQDVGITLRIKSQVGENGTVRMTIYEENSSVSGTSSQVTNKTSVETYVTVDDGAMIALGGLIKDEFNDSTTGVPLLQSIPILGNLFKSSDRTRHKSNLMLFLRPIVIRNQADADKLTINRYDAIRTQQQSLQPDHSLLMRINDAPVVPVVKPNGRIDNSVPADPQTKSIDMPSVSPIPDLRDPPPPAPTK